VAEKRRFNMSRKPPALGDFRRVVVKVGSSLLVDSGAAMRHRLPPCRCAAGWRRGRGGTPAPLLTVPTRPRLQRRHARRERVDLEKISDVRVYTADLESASGTRSFRGPQ